jgi:hypothetical protein
MSLDYEYIKPVLVLDNNLETTDKIFYPIVAGGQENYKQFASNSGSSTSSINYNFTLPSDSSFLDRTLMHYCTLNFTLNLTNCPVGLSCFNYGVTDAFAPFPFNSLINTLSGTINGFQVKNNLIQYKDVYLRTISSKILAKSASYTPSMLNKPFYGYSQYPGTNCNVFSTASNQGYSPKDIPRGEYVCDSITVTHSIYGGGSDNSTISTSVNDSWSITVQATVMEPFLCTGFFLMPDQDDGCGGLIGVNQINLQLTLDSSAKHLWSSATGCITSITMNSITNAALYYKDTQPNSIEAAKVPEFLLFPYTEWNYYLTAQGNSISAGATTTAITSSINFGRVPSMIYLGVRKQMQSQNWNDTGSFLPISNISVSFGAGRTSLLASATQRQLWLITCANLPKDAAPTWQEFSGQINVVGATGTGYPDTVASCGSILALSPALNFQLDDSITEGSVGTFQFQAQVTFTNNTSSSITYEVIILYTDKGIVKASRGQTFSVLGINDVSLVLNTKESEETVTQKEVKEMIGSGTHFHKVGKILKHHKKRKTHVEMEHGAAMSGGYSMSAGSKMRSNHKLKRLAC